MVIFNNFNQADLKEYLKDRKGENYTEEEAIASTEKCKDVIPQVQAFISYKYKIS